MKRPFAFGVRVRGQWVVTVALVIGACEPVKEETHQERGRRLALACKADCEHAGLVVLRYDTWTFECACVDPRAREAKS